MRILFLSNLFPSEREPIRGLDNALLLHGLSALGGIEIRVLSPRARIGLHREPAWQPRTEDAPFQPAFVGTFYVPKCGSAFNDRLLARALQNPVNQAIRTFRPDVLLASWLFPDGCAAAALARAEDLPLVLITQGSDTHAYLSYPLRRRKILRAIDQSRAVVCRSGDLASRLAAAGAPREKLSVVYNGVDRAVFRPGDRASARGELGLPAGEPLFLFVGNFLPVKEPLFLIRVHADWNRRRQAAGRPPGRLVLIGDGPLRPAIQQATQRLESGASVSLPGRLPPEEVARWMQAADALCLCSRNEGFPNVILEALACDLPVISTAVGGIPEKLGSGGGILVPRSDASAFLAAMDRVAIEAPPSGFPATHRLGSTVVDWATAARRYRDILSEACFSRRHPDRDFT